MKIITISDRFPNVKYDKGKMLLFDDGDLSNLVHFDPVLTYILAHSENDYKAFCEKGYYNTFVNISLDKITEPELGVILGTMYEDNKHVYLNKKLVAIYNNKLDVVQAIISLLFSIKVQDKATFKRVIKYSLDDMLSSVKSIKSMIETESQLKDSEKSYKIYEDKIRTLEDNAKQYLKYVEVNEELQSTNKNLSETVTGLKSKLASFEEDNKKLSDALSQRVADQSGMVSEQSYQLAVQDKKICESRLIDLQNRYDNLEKALEVQSHAEKTSSFEGNASNIGTISIRSLEDYKTYFSNMLPILNKQVFLKADKLICIKEVKPAIYMNNFLEYLSSVLFKTYAGSERKSIVIVYDNLLDEFRLAKYRAHKFAINEFPPLSGKAMVPIITNNLSYDFLKDVINIKEFETVIMIDRLGMRKTVMEHDGMQEYFLIDSPNDIKEYNLDKDHCIAFYNDKDMKYKIHPDGTVITKKRDMRPTVFPRIPWFKDFMYDIGVLVHV